MDGFLDSGCVPLSELEGAQWADSSILDLMRGRVGGASPYPLSPELCCSYFAETNDSGQRKHTFDTCVHDFHQQASRFQSNAHGGGIVFPEQVSYPTWCGGLCKAETPAYVMRMAGLLKDSISRYVKRFPTPADASMVIACEVKHGAGSPDVIFVELLTALGRSGRVKPQQAFVEYSCIRGNSVAPYAGCIVAVRREDFVAQPDKPLLNPCSQATLGPFLYRTEDELVGMLLRLPFPFGYADSVTLRPLKCESSFEYTDGYDHLLVLGALDEHEQGGPCTIDKFTVAPKPKAAAKCADEEVDFIAMLSVSAEDAAKSRRAGRPPASGTKPGDAEFSDFCRDLEELLNIPEGLVDDDEDMNEVHEAAKQNAEDDLEVQELNEDNGQHEDDVGDEGAGHGDLDKAQVAEDLLRRLGFVGKPGWQIHSADDNRPVGKLNWIAATDTLSVVCKCPGHANNCKMMLRLPAAERGRHDKFDLICAGYQWLHDGLAEDRGTHLARAAEVKRSFGMKPRVAK